MTLRKLFKLFLCVALVAFLAGCAMQPKQRMRSSVVEYLYPEKDVVASPSIPTLRLPIDVGIAFVPGDTVGGGQSNFWVGSIDPMYQSENQKMELLETVAAHFKQYNFVRNIEIIPSAYLRPKGGFENLDQIRTMYGVDVVALVSYDQVQFTDEDILSLTYWTLVGAYVVEGEKNDTQTLMDTAVYEVESKKLLFRAPGASRVKGRSTVVNLSEELRADSRKGFDEATSEMVANLDAQLGKFKERVKERPNEYSVEYRPGFQGGGAFGWSTLMVLLGVLAWRLSLAGRGESRTGGGCGWE